MLAGRAPWSCPATLVHLHSHFGIYTEEREGENIPSPSSSSPKGQTSLLGQERREDHPLCVGPSHTAAPSPQGWCQLCAMPMLWTMHSTGTNCQNLVPLLPLMKKHSQKCKFTKQCFHWSYLLFHNLFMFLVSLVISLCYSVHICWTLSSAVLTPYMLQPTTAAWRSHLPHPHPLVCSGELPPTWGWSLVGVWSLCPSQV